MATLKNDPRMFPEDKSVAGKPGPDDGSSAAVAANEGPSPSPSPSLSPSFSPDTSTGTGTGTGTSTSTSTSTSTGNDMLDRVVQTAHETVDKLAHTAAPHVQHLQEGLHAVSGRANAQADTLRETGAEWTESLRCTVREHPLAAVATALAVGLLVARLTAPRR